MMTTTVILLAAAILGSFDFNNRGLETISFVKTVVVTPGDSLFWTIAMIVLSVDLYFMFFVLPSL